MAHSRLFAIPLFIVLLSVFMLQLWLHTTHTSTTYDEPFHLFAGYKYLKCGDYGINPEHPPLPKLLAALPVTMIGVTALPADCGTKVTAKEEGFLAGAKFVAENGVDRVLVPARIAMSFVTLLFAVILFLAAREMFGPAEAFVALAILVFEPNFIAHGALVTTDMPITATMFAAVYALYRYRTKPSKLRLLVVAIATGLMLASKHSALLILPILFLLLLADVLFMRLREKQKVTVSRRTLSRGALAFAGVVIVALAILWSGYGFRYYALPNSDARNFAVADYMDRLSGISAMAIQLLDSSHLFPEAYTYGLADIADHNQNHGGSWGSLFFFPLVFSMKSSVALLLLLPLGLAMPGLYRQRPRAMLFLILPAFVYFAITMSGGIKIGVRHLLPVYPFFMILAAAGACALARKTKIGAVVAGLLLLLHAVTSVQTFPNYIAFGNTFWGGTNSTHQRLSDADVDWGQNLKLVKAYAEQNARGRDCWFAYWGPGEVARVSQPCHLLPVSGWIESTENVDIIQPVIDGLVFISIQALPPVDVQLEEPFSKLKPIALLGGGVKVYEGRFDITLAAALSHMGRARQLRDRGRFDEAIAQNREALKLLPDHPQSHLLLAETLAAAGQLEEARLEFENTLQLAQNFEHRPEIFIDRAQRGLEQLESPQSAQSVSEGPK